MERGATASLEVRGVISAWRAVSRFGLGYVATPGLRLETSIAYRPRFAFEGTANFLQTDALQTVSADLQSASGMVAAYMDLIAHGPFSAFAGTGAGLHYVDISEFQMTFPRTQTFVPDGRRVDFTVMLAAGVATSLSDKITLDLAWRYVDWGIVETGKATGQVVWKDGSREPLELDLAETWAMLQRAGIQGLVALRVFELESTFIVAPCVLIQQKRLAIYHIRE